MHFFKIIVCTYREPIIDYTMTLEIPVNVNTTLNQKRLPVIPGFTSLYAYKTRSAFSHFRK